MEAKRKQYEKILREINNQEVVDFLLENLLLDSKLENRFQMKFTTYFSKKTKTEIKEMFKEEWLKISDRGYQSIKYVEAVLEGIGEFQIDGSYG